MDCPPILHFLAIIKSIKKRKNLITQKYCNRVKYSVLNLSSSSQFLLLNLKPNTWKSFRERNSTFSSWAVISSSGVNVLALWSKVWLSSGSGGVISAPTPGSLGSLHLLCSWISSEICQTQKWLQLRVRCWFRALRIKLIISEKLMSRIKGNKQY